MIAFLGMGLLGSNFVRALRKRGQQVQVWNRTHARAEAVAKELDGVRAFESAADAVRDCERVHVCVSDDAAVDDVLEQALPGLTEKTIVVDHTTTSPAGTLARSKRWAER
ncbi:MAG TPA: NAD(P)-binding domain-containing protein, partial [Polyangiaceae bacterium]